MEAKISSFLQKTHINTPSSRGCRDSEIISILDIQYSESEKSTPHKGHLQRKDTYPVGKKSQADGRKAEIMRFLRLYQEIYRSIRAEVENILSSVKSEFENISNFCLEFVKQYEKELSSKNSLIESLTIRNASLAK